MLAYLGGIINLVLENLQRIGVYLAHYFWLIVAITFAFEDSRIEVHLSRHDVQHSHHL